MVRFRHILVASFAFLGQFMVSAKAGIVLATSHSDFMNVLQVDYQRETFDSLMPNVPYADSLTFAQGPYGFEVHADGHGSNMGIYPFENQQSYGDIWLSTNYQGTTLEIRNFLGDPTAIGGEFFVSAFESNVTIGYVTAFAENGSTQISLTMPVTSAKRFSGFYATDGMHFTRLAFSLPGGSNHATINDFVVSRQLSDDPPSVNPVPEPSAIALTAIGTAIAVLLRRRFDSAA